MPKTTKSNTKAKPVTRATRVRTSTEVVIPDEYRPIGMWGYFGYTFLFAIPLIGWFFVSTLLLLAATIIYVTSLGRNFAI